jgi:hypothetical protein|tara:strand:- start:89 stop:331 length:243 start_codon:yes stop_codon:yes gene_type:complete
MNTATGRDAIVLDTPDQIGRYRLAVVKQGIKALLRGMMINRGYTSTACRNFVTERTGVKYPAGKKGLEKALADIEQLLTN